MNPNDAADSPEPGMVALPACTLGKAMDWSLVLMSQGIESSIQRTGEGWRLFIATSQAEDARTAIRLYEAENRPLPWRQEVLHSGLLFDWACVGWALAIMAFFWLSVRAPSLRETGIMDALAVSHGEWWRLFTAIWLHGDLAHLAMNLAIGIPLVGLAMGACGSGTGFLGALLAGCVGNLTSLAFSFGQHRSLGASGLIMGALGLLAAQWLSLRRITSRSRRLAVGGVVAGVMLFVLLGLSPGTDVLAHTGGFVAGLLLGAGIARRLTVARQTHVNVGAAMISAALIIWTWWLALRPGLN